jgi:hypothetical protein
MQPVAPLGCRSSRCVHRGERWAGAQRGCLLGAARGTLQLHTAGHQGVWLHTPSQVHKLVPDIAVHGQVTGRALAPHAGAPQTLLQTHTVLTVHSFCYASLAGLGAADRSPHQRMEKPCPNPKYKAPHPPAPSRGAQRDARALFLPLRFLLRPLAPLEKANLSARRLLASGSPLM